MAKNNAPIIKKVIKKGGHGHHGGAWKVAYADFVTAMMAFFLLLWLLTATPVENLKGLADYFSPTMGLKDKMGIGFRGGQGTTDEGASPGDSANVGLVFGAPPSGPIIKLQERDNHTENMDNDQILFSRTEQDITKAVQESPELKKFAENILIQQTPEGLIIQLLDRKDDPMFEANGEDLKPLAKKILERIIAVVRFLPNYIQLSGHTTSLPPAQDAEKKWDSNWELSAARANSTRRFLMNLGVDPDQIARVTAKADQEPLDREEPEAPENSRVSITLLRNQRAPSHKKVAPEQLLLGEDSIERLREIRERKSDGGNKKTEESAKTPAPNATPAAPAANPAAAPDSANKNETAPAEKTASPQDVPQNTAPETPAAVEKPQDKPAESSEKSQP
jgi:chemotaxis protein MotB